MNNVKGEPLPEPVREEKCILNSEVKTCVNNISSLMGPWPNLTGPDWLSHLSFCSLEVSLGLNATAIWALYEEVSSLPRGMTPWVPNLQRFL